MGEGKGMRKKFTQTRENKVGLREKSFFLFFQCVCVLVLHGQEFTVFLFR